MQGQGQVEDKGKGEGKDKGKGKGKGKGHCPQPLNTSPSKNQNVRGPFFFGPKGPYPGGWSGGFAQLTVTFKGPGPKCITSL